VAERFLPDAKAMVLCDEVVRHPDKGSIDLLDVRTNLGIVSFPYRHPTLCIYLELSGHDTTYVVFVRSIRADTDEVAFQSPPHSLSFPGPLVVKPVLIRIHDCPFPEPGLYWIQFFCDDVLLIEHRLPVYEG
jgi:hypothetical protein